MAGTKPRAGSYLEFQPPQTRKPSIDIVPGAVLSPITELTWTFEHNYISSTRTPKRKLSLSCSDSVPTPSPVHQRSYSSASNESGYCPGSPPGFSGFDSPSLEILKSAQERRRLSQSLTQHQRFFRRWNSLPVETEDNKENINLFGITTTEKLEDSHGEGFNFVQPKDPATRRQCVSSKYAPRFLPARSLSDPIPQGFRTESPVPLSPTNSDSQDSGATDFDLDADGDDGFMDIVQEEQDTGIKSDVPSGMADLLCAPLVHKEDSPETDKNDVIPGTGETPKPVVSNYKPRDLFNTTGEKSDGRGKEEASASGSPSAERIQMRPRSKSFALKRPNPPRDDSPMGKKRFRQRCMSVDEGNSRSALVELPNVLHSQAKRSPLQRSQSATFEYHQKIEHTLSTATRDTIGDFSRPYILPTISGKHEDLKCLTPRTVAGVVRNEFPEIDTAYIIDCRYPYEYEAGHIKGAINVYIKEDMMTQFLKNPKCEAGRRVIIIFHCEFSSKRGPDMCRYLRRNDRDLHDYPKLYYPELYLLEGGYRAFFQEHKELCEPQCYLPMLDENYVQDLKHFSKKSKSWCEGTGRKTLRPGLNYRC